MRDITLGESVNMLEEQLDNIKKIGDSFYHIKLAERLFAYYIFSLSAYADAYCTELVDYILKNASKEYIRKWTKKLDNYKNPLLKFNDILKSFSDDIKKGIQNILDSEDYLEIKKTFKELIELRNDIAHKKPETNLDNIYDRFSHITKFYGSDFKILESPTLENGVEFSNLNELQLLELQIKTLKTIGYHIYNYICYIESLTLFAFHNFT